MCVNLKWIFALEVYKMSEYLFPLTVYGISNHIYRVSTSKTLELILINIVWIEYPLALY